MAGFAFLMANRPQLAAASTDFGSPLQLVTMIGDNSGRTDCGHRDYRLAIPGPKHQSRSRKASASWRRGRMFGPCQERERTWQVRRRLGEGMHVSEFERQGQKRLAFLRSHIFLTGSDFNIEGG
jgi:hypothetical protein